MTIIHPLDSLLYELFPEAEGNEQKLIEVAKRYYTLGPFEPSVSIEGGNLIVDIDASRTILHRARYDQVTSLCERGEFAVAKKEIRELIEEAPNVSEYHRILGQILSEEGDQDGAIDALIDALRWNPKNEWGLLMMGNIFAKYKEDLETALKYYEEVLKIKPDDHIALNNIGANLMQYGRAKEAASYFERAIAINSDYPNTQYALALTAQMQGDDQSAFERSLIALEKNHKRDGLYSNSFRLAIDTASKLMKALDGMAIVERYANELYRKYGKPVEIVEDNSIPTAAKIEFAENYNRDHHLIKYQSGYPAVEHLMLHELVHLELAEEARAAEVNQLYTTKQQHKNGFFFALEKEAKQLRKQGIPEQSIANFLNALFEGLNRQTFNTPIDLFIEDIIYNRFEELKSFQFLSLMALIKEGIEATTKPEIVANAPALVLSKSKIYNLINAIHFKQLYKVDLIKEFKANKAELDQAETLYEEFLEYRSDRSPGEEYEIVQHWGEDLKLDKYFELVPELEYRPKTVETVLAEIENDPFGLDQVDPAEERKMKQFIDAHSTGDVNMAVCMYMVGAITYLRTLDQAQVKEMAFEIAMLGRSGIDPKKEGYSVASLKDKSFSGYQMIAYFYVTWALAIPEMVSQLGLPFAQEYELAKQLAAQ